MMETSAILRRMDRIDDLPTLPAIAMEINRMLLDTKTTINALSDSLAKDQAMVSKLLKLVNSAFFGLRTKISDIPHAVVLLGFNTVRNAVVSISVIDAFDVEDGMDGFDLADFWKHSIAVAVTSKHLAERAQTCPSDDCFVGGLLHDMGKVVLLRHFRDIFQKVWLAAREDEQSFHEAEKGQMQIDHASIGGHLAKKWQLPSSLIDAIRCHHTMYSKVSDFDLLKVVYTADVLVNAYDGDAEVDPASLDIHPGAAKALRRELDTLSDWYPEALLEIESACSFFSTEGA